MANNVDVTAGSGTTIKTTDNAGVHTPHHNVDSLPAVTIAADQTVDVGEVTTLPAITIAASQSVDVGEVTTLPAVTIASSQTLDTVTTVGTVGAVTPPTGVFNGQETVDSAGTAQAIGSSQALNRGVTVKALAGNAGLVYVGNSGVDSTNGFELAAGEAVYMETDNVADIFVDAANNDDGVSWIGS